MKSSPPPPPCDSDGGYHLHCFACGWPVTIFVEEDDCEEFDFHCLKCGSGMEFSERLVLSTHRRTPEQLARLRLEDDLAGPCEEVVRYRLARLEDNLAAPPAERPSSPEEGGA